MFSAVIQGNAPCAAGGRLGVGDQRSRDMPCEVEALRGMHVLQVSAGAWHSAALVLIPPLMSGGWVYTWGRGLHGQLGLGGVAALITGYGALVLLVRLVLNDRLSGFAWYCWAAAIAAGVISFVHVA